MLNNNFRSLYFTPELIFLKFYLVNTVLFITRLIIYTIRKYFGFCENKRLLVTGFRMMIRPRRKSPKWRQFCDRKRIGFSRPIAPCRKHVGQTEGPLKTPEMTRLKGKKIVFCCSCLEQRAPPTIQPFIRTKTLIR